MTGTPWLLPHLYFSLSGGTMNKEEKEDLTTKVYQCVNGIRTVPDIAVKVLGENAKLGTPDFYKVCDAVDELIKEGLVYFRDSDGVLLDLQR